MFVPCTCNDADVDGLGVLAITRAYTLIYTLALLTMLTRVQLNLLGRRSYLSSVVSLATGSAQATISLENNDDDNPNQAYGDDFETNRKYLTFSWWLLNKGWVDVMQRVENAVREVFGSLSPRDQLSFEAFSELTSKVRKLVEGGGPSQERTTWLAFLLPPTDMEEYVLKESGILDDSATLQTQTAPAPSSAGSTSSLRRLLDETADLTESPAFSQVLTLVLDAGFSKLLDQKLAFGAFELPPPPVGGPSPELQRLKSSKTVLLPKILSILTRQAHSIGNGMPNEYLQEMDQVREVEAFAAVVYSSNWENEIRDETLMAEAGHVTATATPATSVRQSQISTADESLVLVDPQASFESAWEKAVEKNT